MLLGTLNESIFGNMLTGRGVNRAGDGIIRAGYGAKESSINEDFWCCLIF